MPEYEPTVAEEARDGSGVYLKRREGAWAFSREAHEAVTLDFDDAGNLIGVEVSAASRYVGMSVARSRLLAEDSPVVVRPVL